MVAAVMAVVHMAACMAVPPPAWPPALPSRTFVLVVVLVLVLGDSAIGDANGALDQGCLQAAVYLYSSPFKYLWSLGAGAAHGLAKSHPGLNLP